MPRGQVVEALARGLGEGGVSFAPADAPQFQPRTAAQDHLAGRVVLGLEQHRVRVDARHGAGGQRLQVRRAADLADLAETAETAIERRHHPRVVAHVLRLQRRHPQAPACRRAAQGGGQPALSGTTGAAPDDECAWRTRHR